MGTTSCMDGSNPSPRPPVPLWRLCGAASRSMDKHYFDDDFDDFDYSDD
jgi:hypothetical protein